MQQLNASRKTAKQGRTRLLWAVLGGLFAMVPVLVVAWQMQPGAASQPRAEAAAIFAPTHTTSTLPQGRMYFVDRRAGGYQLLASDVAGAAVPLATFPDQFGAYPTDTITALDLAPGGAYIAVDGQRDHGDTVWIVATATGALHQVPADAQGQYLHWLPDGQHFLFRAFLPTGADGATFTPGLWIVDAATGTHQAVALPGNDAQAQVIDAVSTPNGTHLLVSLTHGLGTGSEVWQIDTLGGAAQGLWQSPALVSMFAWSPNGQQLAYESLEDSTVPYRPASLWLYAPGAGAPHQLTTLDSALPADGGHGFAPAWSPDSRSIAFVSRLNVANSQADALAGRVVSAISLLSVQSGATTLVASPDQTGLPRNINPAWRANGTIMFTALAASQLGGAAMGRAWLWQAAPFGADAGVGSQQHNGQFQTAQTANATLSGADGLFTLVP